MRMFRLIRWPQGTLFLLNQEYVGTPAGLSTGTSGYLSHTNTTQAEGSGTEWAFSGVTLESSTEYWFLRYQ